MAEYIDREEAVKMMDDCIQAMMNHPKVSKEPYTMANAVRSVAAVLCLAAEVAEVKHGTWKLHKDGSGTCDQCRFTQKNVWDYDNSQNYCGHCGAKMDGKDKENG